jgi:hydroxypyruvate reductase
MNPRRLLLESFDAALRAVDGRESVKRFFAARATQRHRVSVFAIGKAASAMTAGAYEALGPRVSRTLLITKQGHVDPDVRGLREVTVIESSHPVPDERSLAAGEALLRALSVLGKDDSSLFLISGGASSLVEVLNTGFTLEHLQALNREALAEGFSIGRINERRARLSRIKAGGVARLLLDRPAMALFISDVPGDDPDVIGSGLLGEPKEGPRAEVIREVIANVDQAVDAAIEAAAARGFELARLPGRFDGVCADVAREFVERLRACEGEGLVWGGESTVKLSGAPGRGGRNQHLALAAARMLRPAEPIMILAAGTDGTDGPTEDAGAIVDAGTVERAELAGVDVERAWRQFDSGTALEAAEDLVHTGPTGTNVGDILIGIKRNARRFRDPAPPRML